MAVVLRWISNVLPLSYVTDAFTRARTVQGLDAQMWRDLAILTGCLILALGLASTTLRRRTP
jgi:ABC-2 type transport system permease protein